MATRTTENVKADVNQSEVINSRPPGSMGEDWISWRNTKPEGKDIGIIEP